MQLKESGIPVTIGIRNPSSKDKNLEPSDWNPESKIVSDSLTCGDLSVLPTTLSSNKNIYLIKMWMCLAQNTNWHSIWFTRFAEQRSTFTFSLCLDRKWGSRRESKSQPLSCTKGLWSQSIKEKKDIADLQTSHVPTPFIHYHCPYLIIEDKRMRTSRSNWRNNCGILVFAHYKLTQIDTIWFPQVVTLLFVLSLTKILGSLQPAARRNKYNVTSFIQITF